MVHAAHASRYHWGEIGAPLEFERGGWQISRVYATLMLPEPALVHAERCHAICIEKGIGDSDLAFAYEALARAYAISGDITKSRAYVDLGTQAADHIQDTDNRDYFLGELAAVKEMLR